MLEFCTLAVFQRSGDGCSQALPQDLLDQLPDLEERLVRVEWSPVDISSSEVRRRVSLGNSVRHMVPECVNKYIRRHNLYRSAEGGARGDHAT